jgi:hypothetical protein
VKSFHFSLGNSSKGPIGFCAAVKAEDKTAAVKKLRKALVSFGQELDASKATGIKIYHPEVEYLQVYFNSDAITLDSIDEVEKAP